VGRLFVSTSLITFKDEALELAIDHLKDGGQLVLTTDASPYEDADLAGLTRRLKEKHIKLTAIISGDCAQGGASLNEVTTK
jgi:hypothetical protein